MLTRHSKKRRLQLCGRYDFFWLYLIGEFIGDRMTMVSLRTTRKLTSHIKGNCGFDTVLGKRFSYAQYASLCLKTNLQLDYSYYGKHPYKKELEDENLFQIDMKEFEDVVRCIDRCKMVTKTKTMTFVQLANLKERNWPIGSYFLVNEISANETFAFCAKTDVNYVYVSCKGNPGNIFELDILLNDSKDNIIFLFGDAPEIHCKLKSNVRKLVVFGFGSNTMLQMECPDMNCIRHYTDEEAFLKSFDVEVNN